MKTSPIYLDRLAKALGAHGISLNRSQLLEVAAASFGFHNSNEFSAAAKRGDLNPPAATPIGTVALPNGESVLLVQDTLANAPYGIDESFISRVVDEERGESIGVTPFGNLAFLGDLSAQTYPQLATSTTDTGQPAGTSSVVTVSRRTLETLIGAAESYTEDLSTGLDSVMYDEDPGCNRIEQAIETAKSRLNSQAPVSPKIIETGDEVRITIYTANVDHRHGTNTYVAFSYEDLLKQLADYCSEYWSEIEGEPGVPENCDDMDDQEIVSMYFDTHPTESCSSGDTTEIIPACILDQLRPNTQASKPAPLLLGEVDLPSAEWLTDVAASLETGATADIWYDALEFADEDEEEDPSPVDTINETQLAMTEAASILRRVASATAAAPAPASVRFGSQSHPDHEEGSDLIWLTDVDGDPTTDGLSCKGELDKLGLSYQVQDGEFLPLTDREFEVITHLMRPLPPGPSNPNTVRSRYKDSFSIAVGATALYRGRKFHAAEIGIMWGPDAENTRMDEATTLLRQIRDRVEPAITALGGYVIANLEATDNMHELSFLLPFSVADDAVSLDAYYEGLDYFINGTDDPEAKTVTARFRPQAWQNDYAISVDPEGETTFDVTFELLLIGYEKAGRLEQDDVFRDELRYACYAPKWIQDWSGPFEVDIDQGDIDRLFNIAR